MGVFLDGGLKPPVAQGCAIPVAPYTCARPSKLGGLSFVQQGFRGFVRLRAC